MARGSELRTACGARVWRDHHWIPIIARIDGPVIAYARTRHPWPPLFNKGGKRTAHGGCLLHGNLAHALERVSISIGHLALDRVKVNVVGASGQFDDLGESLLGLQNAGRWDIISGTAARRMIGLPAITTAALLVFNSNAVDEAPGPPAKIAEHPTFNIRP